MITPELLLTMVIVCMIFWILMEFPEIVLIAMMAMIAFTLAHPPMEKTVDSQYGPIVCQLFGTSGSPLDYALTYPSEMTQETANSICKNVGEGILELNDI